jgi:hypothetical protein
MSITCSKKRCVDQQNVQIIVFYSLITAAHTAINYMYLFTMDRHIMDQGRFEWSGAGRNVPFF